MSTTSSQPGSLRSRGPNHPGKMQNYLEKIKRYGNSGAASETIQDGEPVPTSGPQGKVVPLTIVNDPADWTSESLKNKEEYTWTLNEKDVQDIIRATNKITSRLPTTEESVKDLTKEDYDWPEFAEKVIVAAKDINGRGFHIIRGFPVEHFRGNRYGLVVAFWGLALTLGQPQVSQTDYDRDHKIFGSYLNHVSVGRHTSVKSKHVHGRAKPDESYDEESKSPRDQARLRFHSDQGATDLIALLSLNKAKFGGESRWVSAVAIHNEMLRRGRKDLVEVLSTPGIWQVPKKVDQAIYSRDEDGKFSGFEDDPPFVYHNGFLSSHFASANYQQNQLTPLQKEAVWTFAAIAEDPKFYLAQLLEPGDIEIISNQVILHSRSRVVNGVVPHENRQLLRWWVAQPLERNPRGIIPSFAPRSNVGPEGGFRIPEGSNIRLPFYPYTLNDGEGQSEW